MNTFEDGLAAVALIKRLHGRIEFSVVKEIQAFTIQSEKTDPAHRDAIRNSWQDRNKVEFHFWMASSTIPVSLAGSSHFDWFRNLRSIDKETSVLPY
jgi:hypothetical protein